MAHMTQVMETECIKLFSSWGLLPLFADLWSSSATAEELNAGETTNRILSRNRLWLPLAHL
jgi:hypothetical protein